MAKRNSSLRVESSSAYFQFPFSKTNPQSSLLFWIFLGNVSLNHSILIFFFFLLILFSPRLRRNSLSFHVEPSNSQHPTFLFPSCLRQFTAAIYIPFSRPCYLVKLPHRWLPLQQIINQNLAAGTSYFSTF